MSEQFQNHRGKIDTPNTYLHDRSLSWLGTGTSIRSGGIKLLSWSQTSSPRDMMRPCKCFPSVSEMSALAYNWGAVFFIECYDLEHYIHFFVYIDNIINLRVTEVVTFSII